MTSLLLAYCANDVQDTKTLAKSIVPHLGFFHFELKFPSLECNVAIHCLITVGSANHESATFQH